MSVAAGVTLDIDVTSGEEEIKNLIDFYGPSEIHRTNEQLQDLNPRYVTYYSVGAGNAEKIREFGYELIPSLSQEDSAGAFDIVSEGKEYGVEHYVLWTEPNRTWPDWGGANNWLTDTTWESFIYHAAGVMRGAREADPECLISAPCITTDPKDAQWFYHVRQFLDSMRAWNIPVDYVNVHPPWEPNDVLSISGLAKAYANLAPDLGIKGLSVGEYPFVVDEHARHVRFFAAFETAWNCEFACKSSYWNMGANSGLSTSQGELKPVYWVFWYYSRMTGRRLDVAMGKTAKLQNLQALSSYNQDEKKLFVLLGNDAGIDTSVVLSIGPAEGSATVRVEGFESDGFTLVREDEVIAANGSITLDLGLLPDTDALAVTVEFDTDPMTSVRNRPSLLNSGRVQSGKQVEAYSIMGRRLVPYTNRAPQVEATPRGTILRIAPESGE